MRVGAGFNASTQAVAAAPVVARSVWQSPVPYLFGGLAAMLGLIALALLVLACSYWMISCYHDDGREGGDAVSDVKRGCEPVTGQKYLRTGVVVIMAGDEIPTFLATPIACRDGLDGVNENEKRLDRDGIVSICIPLQNQNQEQSNQEN